MLCCFADPPETPVISGYDHTSKITVQETLVLLCIARGGNPLAEVHWFRNGDSIDFSYEATADDSRNELILVVVSSDNGAVYRCEASNRVTAAPLTAEITLTVLCKSSFTKSAPHGELNLQNCFH